MVKHRRAWTPEEDNCIKELVQLYGDKHWSIIAQKLKDQYRIKGRTGKQCRERWKVRSLQFYGKKLL